MEKIIHTRKTDHISKISRYPAKRSIRNNNKLSCFETQTKFAVSDTSLAPSGSVDSPVDGCNLCALITSPPRTPKERPRGICGDINSGKYYKTD